MPRSAVSASIDRPPTRRRRLGLCLGLALAAACGEGGATTPAAPRALRPAAAPRLGEAPTHGVVVGGEQGLPPPAQTGPALGDQVNPRLALGDASHLIAWSDARDGSVPAVYAVVRETSNDPAAQTGVRLGAGRLTGERLRPAVAHTAGVYGVAWASFDTVYFARVDESGAVLDVPARTLFVGGAPESVAVAGRDGELLVAWVDRASGQGGLRGLRVSAAGAPLDAAPVWLLEDAHEQRDLSLRARADGYWAVFSDDRGGSRDVALLSLGPTGAPLDAAPLVVGAGAGDQREPDLAFDAAGDALVVWTDDPTSAVHGARVVAGATPTVGAAVLISTGSHEQRPRLAFTGDAYALVMMSDTCGEPCPVAVELPASGPKTLAAKPIGGGGTEGVDVAARGATVEAVWSERSAETIGADVRVRRAPTSPVGPTWLASRAADTQLGPLVAAMASRFVTAWATLVPGGVRIQAARVAPTGALEDVVPRELGDITYAVGLTAVVSSGTTALVAWSERRSAPGAPGTPDWRLRVNRLTAAGAVVDGQGLELHDGSSPIVADAWIDASTSPARFVVSYVDGDVLWDQGVPASGAGGPPVFRFEHASLIATPWLRSTSMFVYWMGDLDQRVHRLRRSTGAAEVWSDLPAKVSSVSVARRIGQHAVVYQDNLGASPAVSVVAHDDAGALSWRLDALATGSGTLAPRITAISDGYLVTWRADGGIVGLRLAPDGRRIDASPAVVSNEPGTELPGGMATDIGNRAMLVYARFVDEPGVRAHRTRTRVIDLGAAGAGAAAGAACDTGFACASGYCVDGVCCDAACGFGDPADCQACAVAAGAAVDGACKPLASSHVCRPASGPCDVAETCDGAPACPADTRAPAGASCGTTPAGACDAPDVCDGVAAGCPDLRHPAGTVCRAASDACDVAEICDGAASACPADTFAPAGQPCRASAGPCDPAESCDGLAAACPGDALASAGTVCRSASGACDLAEACDGASVGCPPDGFAAAGTACRPAAGPCDLAETCSGVGPTCRPDLVAGADVVCRPATGVCDVEERCSGLGTGCPGDALVSNGTACDDGLQCNGVALCSAGSCVAGTPLTCDEDLVCAEPGACVPATDDPRGCGCAVGGGAPRRPVGLALAALVAMLAARRRRRA